MAFMFATSERGRALRFLRKIYPNITDTDDCGKMLLDLVEQDILRIPDPDYHRMENGQLAVIPGHNFTPDMHSQCVSVCKAFVESCETEKHYA